MSNSPLALLKTRRLGPLAIVSATGAFNDNLIKAAIVSLVIFRLGVGGAGLSALAGALFIAPYALLSATSGQLADRFSKPLVIRAAKSAELALMLGAALALISANVNAMFAVLFGLGLQATMFGPVKYGILPEHLAEDELIAGNGALEATTFLTIVAGTVAGGGLALLDDGAEIVGGLGLASAVLGMIGAWLIPPAPAAAPSLRIGLNIFAETWRNLRAAAAIRPIWRSILGLSWFWTMGATLLTEFPVVVRDTLHAPGGVLTLLLAVFAIGVGIGSGLCAKLLHGEVSPRFVPFAALGLSLFCWDFASAAAAAGAGSIASVQDALSSWHGIRMLADLLLLAMCGGVFSVPLYAIIQDRSEPKLRSRMIAANNIMNALFMVAGAGVAAGLAAAGADAPTVLTIAAAANLAVALWIVRLLPQATFRAIFRF
jgi:acyl-[acyl-carrier-protein]-phospholipid O-acyltransferase/long-chain-fatty-acid--[acyl-carrier-protein] ligase